MFQPQIACRNFLFLNQPMTLQNWIMETREIPKELGLFYDILLTVLLYIQLDKFIIFYVTLPTPSHQVPSNFMVGFKSLRLNLLNIVTLLTLKVVLGYYPTRLKIILIIFKYFFSNSTLTETVILLSQPSVHFKNRISLKLFINILVIYIYQT